MYKVALTGHRPNKLGGYNDSAPLNQLIISSMDARLLSLAHEHPEGLAVISGLALGIDQWGAELALQRRWYLICAAPFFGQWKVWPKSSQERYWAIRDAAQEMHIISEGGYTAKKMQIRNEWMVDRANEVLSVWDGTSGGTGNCVGYCDVVGKPRFNINPNELRKEL